MFFNIIEQKKGQDEAVLFIEGELDIFSIEDVMKKIDEQTAQTVSLDLSDVTFMDSSGIGLMIRKIIDWQERGKVLTFTNTQPAIKEVLEEMGAFTILEEVRVI